MSDASSTLIRLIDAAERIVCCRPPATDLAELDLAVTALQPPVSAPLSPAPELLVTALRACWQPVDGNAWRVVAATLLPIVREDLSRIMEARRRPLEPDIHRGGSR